MSAATAPARRLGLRGRIALLLVTASLLALGAAVASAVALIAVIDARKQLLDRLVPADQANRDLLVGLLDQETGIRGYTLSGDTRFLEPYERGRAEEADAMARLRRSLEGRRGLLALAERAAAAAEVWHAEVAVPTQQLVAAGSDEPASAAFLDAGKVRFDAFRAARTELETGLAAAQRTERNRLDDTTTILIATVALVLLALAGAAVVLWFALRRLVIRPVLRLRADVAEVSGGRLDHAIVPQGPPELAELAGDVETMRVRILAELEEARLARAEADDRAEELARSNADLEQFAYVASHDLQEPLRKVASFCQLLQQRYGGQLDERADQYIGFAVDGAKRMQALINDLLAFSRVGRTTSDFAPVALDDVLARVERLYAAQLEELGGTLTVEGPLPTIAGDASLLDALFGNLVGNAIKFRGEEPPRIHVSARAEGPGEGWRVTISDEGIGIDPKYAERVFVLFQRLHGRDVYPGTGIGLALSRRIVEYHGGRMWLDLEARPGATFHLTFPEPESDE